MLEAILSPEKDPSAYLLVAVSILGVTMTFTWQFLVRTRSSLDSTRARVDLTRNIFDTLSARIDLLETNQAKNLTDADRSTLNEQIKNYLTKQSKDEILNQIRASIRQDENAKDIIEPTDKSIERIQSEISSLVSRGSLSLWIGILATLIGILVLVYFVLTAAYQSVRIEEVFATFLPRLSVVVFIQVFAFFFLNLYKSSLKDIKGYHEKLTRLEEHKTALIIACKSDDLEFVRGMFLAARTQSVSNPQS